MFNLETDCSLDLAEAIDMLKLLHFAGDLADNKEDWFAIRQPVISAIYVVEKAVQLSLRKVEADPAANSNARAH